MKKRLLITFTAVLALVLCGLAVYELFFVKTYPLRYREEIVLYSDIYSVPADLICSLINVESGYDPDAVSGAGAVGLMQLLPSTAEEIAWRLGIDGYDLCDVSTNIRFGTYYLSYLYKLLDDWKTAAAAYNAGIGQVKLWLADAEYSADGVTLKTIPFKETASYVKRVFAGREIYADKLNK